MDERALQKSSRALLLIDVINPLDFPGAENLAGPAVDAARAIKRLKASLRREGVPAIYANDNYGVWQSEFAGVARRCQAKGGPATELVKHLSPKRGDFTILKPRHSAFLGTPLDLILERMGVRSLIVAGFATDICVHLTAMDAFLRGFKLLVPSDCTAAESEGYKQQSLEHMRRVLRCDTTLSTQLEM